MRIVNTLIVLAVAVLASACARNPYLSRDSETSGRLSDQTLLLHASAGPLELAEGRLITGNDDAFRSKLELIEGATDSLDLMYYIYADDYSSSVLSRALIEAARRGVRVRLLLDYATNYPRLDLFTLMERLGSAGAGSLEVRFYNRPTRHIIQDAVYLTMGCGEARERFPAEACDAAKLAAIQQRFEAERIDGRAAAELGISNLDSGYSGLFLSGLYGRQPQLMAFAVLNGQAIDPAVLDAADAPSPADRERLQRLGRLYLDARLGPPVRQLAARLQLAVLGALFGAQINPLHEALVGYLPVERQGVEDAARDWEYLSDFLHHKLLLADTRALQLGGRNIEDSYHMRPNRLLDKYMFLDTDLYAELDSGGEAVRDAFDALWNFRVMVAGTAEIRSHAPNDIAANAEAFAAAESRCAGRADQLACIEREFGRRARTLAEREARHAEHMEQRAQRYRTAYPYRRAPDPEPAFAVDPETFAVYIENLPFRGGPGARATQRSHGSVNGQEAHYGKRIHALWLAGLENTCRAATAAEPKQVVLHQAYFFPPANLIRGLAGMIDGNLDCRHVTLTLLTNSLETTDLNVVNLFARHALKAFTEYHAERSHPERAARLVYHEYLAYLPGTRLSLHSKVTVLGDDFYVGSANADVRSLMMDSNNGLLLRRAPELLEDYLEHLDALLADPGRTREATRDVLALSREQMLEQDRRLFREFVERYRAERWLDAEQQARAETQLIERLDDAYRLTRAMLFGPDPERAAQAFDREFKPL